MICSLPPRHCNGVFLRKCSMHLMTTVRLQCKNKNEASHKQNAVCLVSQPCRSHGRARTGEAAGVGLQFIDKTLQKGKMG